MSSFIHAKKPRAIKEKYFIDGKETIRIGSVDSFQGKEFDIVFLSCVRSNDIPVEEKRKRIGHVDDLSRLCVAFTRARQLMVVVGDGDTVGCVPALSDFMERCKKGGSYYEQI